MLNLRYLDSGQPSQEFLPLASSSAAVWGAPTSAGGTTAGAGGQHGWERRGCEDTVSGVPFWVDLSHQGSFPQLLALALNNCFGDS